MNITELNANNYEAEVLQSNQTVVVDFWAPWCGPCKMITPIVEEISREVTDVKVCKVNVDDESELARKYKVMTIPTLILFKEGNAVATSVGLKPKNAIIDMIRNA